MFRGEFDLRVFETQMYKKEEACFEVLKKAVAEYGFKICYVEMIARSGSMYAANVNGVMKTMPRLHIFVEGRSAYQKVTGANEETARMVVRRLWRAVCMQFQLDLTEHYDDKMFICFEQIEKRLYSHFIQSYRNQIAMEAGKSIGGNVWQIYVVSGKPALHLLFTTKVYKECDVESKKEKACADIRTYARRTIAEFTEHDDFEADFEDCLQIYFWHPEMPGYEEQHFGWRWDY